MRIASVDRTGNLRGVVDDCLIALFAAAARGQSREHALRIEHALALMIPGILAEDTRHRIAARL